jgi:prepilin peptidase CpaA
MSGFIETSVLLLWGLLCALQDARSRRISNWLTLGMLVCAAAVLWYGGSSLTGARAAAAGLAMGLGLALTLPGYVSGRVGAADVKLMAALGLASSPMHVLLCFACAALGMLLWAAIGPRLWPRLGSAVHTRLRMLDPADKQSQPYAPFIFPGLLAALIILL